MIRRLLHSRSFWLTALVLVALVFWFFVLPYRYTAFLLLGIAAVWGVFILLEKLAGREPWLAKILGRVFTLCLTLILVACVVTEGFILSGSRGAEEPKCDYVLVLGAGVNGTVPSRSLSERLQAAYDYLTAYPQARCVVSGGQGGGENISEAQCMFNWLTNRGIDPERIWMEDQATSTQENILFTLNLIEERTGTRPTCLAVVSSEYHLYRASLMARDQGVTMLGVPATTYPYLSRLHYYFREMFGLWYYILLG